MFASPFDLANNVRRACHSDHDSLDELITHSCYIVVVQKLKGEQNKLSGLRAGHQSYIH
jgi:hypothetical protein